jgi:hypothetical protein
MKTEYGMSDDEILTIVYCIKETPIEDCVISMRKFAESYAVRKNKDKNQKRSPNYRKRQK